MRAGVIVSKVYSSLGISGWGIFTISFRYYINYTHSVNLFYLYIALHLTITINFLSTNIQNNLWWLFSDMVVSYKIIYCHYDLGGYFKMP